MPVIGRETQERIERLRQEIDECLSYDLPVRHIESEINALAEGEIGKDSLEAHST